MSLLLRITIATLCLLPTLLVAQPLLSADELKGRLGEDGLVVLDIQDKVAFQRYHIPDAVSAPYGVWRTNGKDGKPASMLPPVPRLEKMLGALGISEDSKVVIVATGRSAGDLAAAARVFWTFKVLGHRDVSVLDGGLVAFVDAGGRLAKGPSPSRMTTYKAAVDQDLLLDTDAAAALLAGNASFVDARTEGEYLGIYGGGKKTRAGTIPGAHSLPYDWISKDGGGQMRDSAELKALFKAREIDPNAPQVHFCASGSRASLTWFAAYALFGNENAKLYDGSMDQWGPRKDLPIDQKIKLCESC